MKRGIVLVSPALMAAAAIEAAEISERRNKELDDPIQPWYGNPVFCFKREPEQWQGKGKRRKPKQR